MSEDVRVPLDQWRLGTYEGSHSIVQRRHADGDESVGSVDA